MRKPPAKIVVNVVTYTMTEQMSLSSTEYGRETNEFIKSGLHRIAQKRSDHHE